MHPQERELLVNFLERFQRLPAQSSDPEAESLIRQAIRRPDAAYLLIQQAIVHEIALQRAEQRIQQLEQDLQSARGAPSSSENSGSFLGGLFGSAANNAPRSRAGWTDTPAPPQPQQSWGQSSPPPSSRSGSGFVGSFLASAAAAAAGVAGGALLFEGIRGFVSGGSDENSPPTADAQVDAGSTGDSSFLSGLFGGDSSDPSAGSDSSDDSGSGWI